MGVKIVTDSSCDLPRPLVQELGIAVIPLRVNLGLACYSDGVDISTDKFLSLLHQASAPPTTSQPPPRQFTDVAGQLLGRGDQVLIITLSSALSGTFQSALLAARALTGVEVVDSRLVSAGLGLLVKRTARFARQGAGLKDVAQFARQQREEINLLATLDSVEHIVRGGRLSLFAKNAARQHNVKLIFSRNQVGQVEILARVRGRRLALERMVDLLGARKEVVVTHVNCPEEAHYVAGMIRSRYQPDSLMVNEAGSAVSVYAGAGALIIAG